MICLTDMFIKYFDRPFSVGTVIHSKYIIKKMIGMGSYGFAYIIKDIQSGEERLLKQLRKRIKVKNSSFAYEVDILSSLSHPSIPKLFDSFTWKNKQFIVMTYFPAKNFEDIIFKDKQRFSERESLLILYKAGQAIDYLHEKNIIHRDLRIPNILYDNDRIYIIDFGLARRIGHKNVETRKHNIYDRRIEVKSDLNALGHFLLFLLYSTFEPTSNKEKRWQEELEITRETKSLVERLLGIRSEYGELKDLLADIQGILMLSAGEFLKQGGKSNVNLYKNADKNRIRKCQSRYNIRE